MIQCTKCNKQGVGECTDPRKRIPTYTRHIQARTNIAVDGDDLLPARGVCKHFLDTPHTIGDFSFTLIDRLPVVGLPAFARGPVRRRLELLWMARLHVELNKNMNWVHSFPGALDKPRGCRRR